MKEKMEQLEIRKRDLEQEIVYAKSVKLEAEDRLNAFKSENKYGFFPIFSFFQNFFGSHVCLGREPTTQLLMFLMDFVRTLQNQLNDLDKKKFAQERTQQDQNAQANLTRTKIEDQKGQQDRVRVEIERFLDAIAKGKATLSYDVLALLDGHG